MKLARINRSLIIPIDSLKSLEVKPKVVTDEDGKFKGVEYFELILTYDNNKKLSIMHSSSVDICLLWQCAYASMFCCSNEGTLEFSNQNVD